MICMIILLLYPVVPVGCIQGRWPPGAGWNVANLQPHSQITASSLSVSIGTPWTSLVDFIQILFM